jgi:phenylpropionate dioxygenase-like ring-hydroxylating dioxygenase large terminal subunit
MFFICLNLAFLSVIISYKLNSKRFQVNMVNHGWYVIGESDKVCNTRPTKVTINNTPLAVWKDKQGRYSGIYDVCPHRGASLSKGRIDKNTDCVVCPYHTFKYNCHGRLVQTPGQKHIRSNEHYNYKTDVPYFKIVSLNGWLYMNQQPIFDIKAALPDENTIWVEPEAGNTSFRSITLNKRFKMDARTVTENSLDILHISEVHSFGNKKRPLPLSERLEKIAEGHHKYIYEYEAGENSMAAKIFGKNKLIVENEYILPHYTVARVIFGEFVNTVVTSALPINNDETLLYVKTYRNNWVFNMPLLDDFFDGITKRMMDKTICEDKAVIEQIYSKYKDGNFITKYDDLTQLYREDYHNLVNRVN